MDYRAIMPKPYEVIAQALESCQHNDCKECPYTLDTYDCNNLAHNAAKMLTDMGKKLDGDEDG